MHVGVCGVVDLEQHLQYRHHQGKGKEGEQSREDVEYDIEYQILLIWRHEAQQYGVESFHNKLR